MQQDNFIYEAFFQKNTSYYLDKLEKFRNGQRFTFNLYAFLFGFAWFLYRRMYRITLLLLLVLALESVLEAYLIEFVEDGLLKKAISYALNISIWTGTAFVGNYFYIHRANSVVNEIASKNLSEEEATQYARKKGGTSLLFLFVLIAIIVSLVLYNNQIIIG